MKLHVNTVLYANTVKLYVNTAVSETAVCKDRHSMYVRKKGWSSTIEVLRCVSCSTSVSIRIPDYIPLAQGNRYAQEIADKINKGIINVEV